MPVVSWIPVMFMFCISLVAVMCVIFLGESTFYVGATYFIHILLELGYIQRWCVQSFAVIEREVRSVSHRGYLLARRVSVRS